MTEQFAGSNLYDNTAVCMSCGVQHLIPKSEKVNPQPWLDWLAKHPGHETFILPTRALTNLGDVAAFRHNADIKIAYGSSAAYTITLAGLASSSALLTGRESTSVSNTTNKYLDELVAGRVHVNESSAVSSGTQIEVHAVGALDDSPTWPNVFDGTDSDETIQSEQTKMAICAPIAVMIVDATTANLAYFFRPLGIRQLFGDGLPPAHVVFVTHNTGQTLGATSGNHFIKHTPVYSTVT